MIGPTNASTPEELTELALSIARHKLSTAQDEAFRVKELLKNPYDVGEAAPQVQHDLPPGMQLPGGNDVPDFGRILDELAGLFQGDEPFDAQGLFDAMRNELQPTKSAVENALQRCKAFLRGGLPLDPAKVEAIKNRAIARLNTIGATDVTALTSLYANRRWRIPAGAMAAATYEIDATTAEHRADFGRAFIIAQWEAVLAGLATGMQAMLSAMKDGLGAALDLAQLKQDGSSGKEALALERTRINILQRLAQAQLNFNRSQVDLAEAQLMIPLSEIDDAASVHQADARMRLSMWQANVDLAADKLRGLGHIGAAEINGSAAGTSVDADVSIV